ncbi:nucleotidyltransferase domain-containing protein [Candidatus Thiosymbion oneisti]|uniref:nucleotidyltransferase domain-containing protein n=1 Tax=Candidatus Thiosymbion oneisti TaxID=589554 RepID=UPI0013FDD273|nr:nucleotidyltransferase family protein [Candidatus Thiosymbion oneisti]
MSDTYHPSVLLLARALSGRPIQVPRPSRKVATRLLKTATSHGVTAMLDYRVRQGIVHGLADEDQKALRAANHKQVVYDLMLIAATRKTIDLLATADIPVLLLKGTPIALRYYQAPYLRIRCDTDLFIQAADTDLAAEVLASNGYRLSGLDQGSYASKQFVALSPSRQDFAVSFDIHWRLSNRVIFNNILQFEQCWRTRQPLPELGGSAYMLSPPQLLLHACIHRIAHGRNTMRNRLIWLYDIHLITSGFSAEDFDRFQRLAIEKQVGTLCLDALVICQYYFHTTYPKGYLTAMTRNYRQEPSAHLLHASKPRWALADLLALNTLHERLAFADELLFPPHLAEATGWLPRMKAWIARLLAKIG